MDQNAISRGATTPVDPYSVVSVRWAIVVLGSHTFAAVFWSAVVGAFLGVPLRTMLVPFAMFALCGLVLTPLLGWSYRANTRPTIGAVRMGLTSLIYLQAFMAALGLSAVWLGKLSMADVVSVGPWMFVSVALVAVASGLRWRRRLQGGLGSQ
jgi:hypothetical protein